MPHWRKGCARQLTSFQRRPLATSPPCASGRGRWHSWSLATTWLQRSMRGSPCRSSPLAARAVILHFSCGRQGPKTSLQTHQTPHGGAGWNHFSSGAGPRRHLVTDTLVGHAAPGRMLSADSTSTSWNDLLNSDSCVAFVSVLPLPKGYHILSPSTQLPCANLLGSQPSSTKVCHHPTVFSVNTIGQERDCCKDAMERTRVPPPAQPSRPLPRKPPQR